MTNLAALPLLDLILEQGLINSAHIYLGLSGGVDSVVLLDLVHQAFLRKKFDLNKLSAIHINHKLQEKSDDWQMFCFKLTQQYQIHFIAEKIQERPKIGESIEDFARMHRYHLFFNHVRPNKDMLLLAHHLDDQAETVLFRLLKGAGPKGLSGMSILYHYQNRTLYRPLLSISKQIIKNYALEKKLSHINDPSNALIDYDRNFLRQTILPTLSDRFGAVNQTIARGAQHYQQQQQALDYFLEKELIKIQTEHISKYYCLDFRLFFEYPSHIQAGLLRKWFESHQYKNPSEKKMSDILKQLNTAKADKIPEISWGKSNEYLIRKYQHKIFINKANKSRHNKPIFSFSELIENNLIEIRFRTFGQKVYFLNKDHSVCLKKFLQSLGVPPWDRNIVPLYFYQEKYLVGVEGYWIAKI